MRPAGALLLLPLLLAAWPAAAADAPCIDCLSFRLDPPEVVRGPFPDELDNAFTALHLRDGGWRGFSANGATYAIDGASLNDMGGARRTVLEPGPKGSDAECGRWLNTVLPVGDALYGLVHQEAGCDYGHGGQTHKSVAIAVSHDQGLSWDDLGTVISGADAATPGKGTGEGDCTMVDGQDGYAYAYCLRLSDYKTIVARAPLTALGPGNWRKYDNGRWSSPGLGGGATSIGFVGVASAYFRDPGAVALLVADPWFHGVRLSLSTDKVHFTDLPEPLIPLDATDWERPAPSELVAYIGVLDPETGANTVGEDFVLATAFLPPGATFADRYLALQRVHMRQGEPATGPQVGVALARWSLAGGGSRTTTGPVIDKDAAIDSTLGYLMTKAPDGAPSVKLEECALGHGYRLEIDGTCALEGATRLRTAGWAYDDRRPDTRPLYRCAGVHGRFVSNDPACEGRGDVEMRLGFALAE